MVADPSESVFSRESIAVGAPSPAAGGLFPRPASLQRHWSDGLRKQAETATERKPTAEGGVIGIGITSPIPRLRQSSFHDPDRIRPLSFNGVSNGYGSMKITEAAALESRVGELEAQVADLRSIIAESANWLPSRPVPFDDGVLRSSPSHSFSRPDSDTAVAPDESILRFESISPRGSVAARDRSLAALEGITFDNENKRHTVSTIRGPRRGSTSMRSTSDSPHSVNLAEYTGIVAMVKREQKARKRLEQQVATLQEQMAAVLHRQLVSESTSRSATMLDTHRRLNAHLHRKASSEVPTPDITPPASSAARQSANMFTSFDHAISDGEEEDEEDGVGSFYDGHGQSDAWGTPAEEKGDAMSALERTGTHQTFGDPLMGFSPQARTLSLSRITRDSSLMAQRV
ncbi:hypothetical protein FN846DRAFT_309558 [Sphaerosporella brunnea]|uniref:Uncharacterized protein n=1 Tax=Sphaerosporella brunnea TaxID=1250544 RepID=A0A5J5F6V6_9PEZI|nr:hypothetical protein FN846DRAFT_309558 [Sphaerosporella brunnea]